MLFLTAVNVWIDSINLIQLKPLQNCVLLINILKFCIINLRKILTRIEMICISFVKVTIDLNEMKINI